jgi:L-histidine N-alpha-methyltransferase
LDTLGIDTHPSVGEEALALSAISSLRANRIYPKFLYVTPRQTALWREVFCRHSPVHGNPEFARIYQEVFARTAVETGPKKVVVVGLGCGTGLKEAQLCAQLKAQGSEPIFAAVDVSRDLVTESVRAVTAIGAEHRRSLVCDLNEVAYLADWLDRTFADLPRVITFFGLVPNLTPSFVTQLFRAVLRPGDVLLVSAHLAPVSENVPLAAAMQKVLPQYDNAETQAWLGAALEAWNISGRVDPPKISIGEVEWIPAFIAWTRWISPEPFEQWGVRFEPGINRGLLIFQSLRYTPELFEEKLEPSGLRAERLALTACLEEGIWAVRR